MLHLSPVHTIWRQEAHLESSSLKERGRVHRRQALPWLFHPPHGVLRAEAKGWGSCSRPWCSVPSPERDDRLAGSEMPTKW